MDALSEKEVLIQSRDILSNINNAIKATDTAILSGVERQVLMLQK